MTVGRFTVAFSPALRGFGRLTWVGVPDLYWVFGVGWLRLYWRLDEYADGK